MTEKRFILWRLKGDYYRTLGVFMVVDAQGWPLFISPCLERGDRNNKKNVSRANAGTHRIILEWSPTFKDMLWEIKGLEPRTEIKVHIANLWQELEGCIALGLMLQDLDKDGYQDVASSGDALARLKEVMKGVTETTITIIDPPAEVMPGPLYSYLDGMENVDDLHAQKEKTIHPDARERIQARIDQIYRNQYFAS